MSRLGRFEEAVAALREAVRVEPQAGDVHLLLSNALAGMGEWKEATREYEEAVRMDPQFAFDHSRLSELLLETGSLEDALALCRKTVHIAPDSAEAHCQLGRALSATGAFQEGLEELRLGHELGMKRTAWPYPSAQWVAEDEQFLKLDATLPDVLAGKVELSNPIEKVSYGELCCRKRLFVPAATFYADALADPAMDDHMIQQYRYQAACAAAMAGSSSGNDGVDLDGAEQTRWRRQALQWLQADLEDYDKQLETGPPEVRSAIVRTLQQWQAQPDLAGLREADSISKLPEDEQQLLRTFWADCDRLLKRAAQPRPHRTQA